MQRILIIFTLLLCSLFCFDSVKAQDTTWVQTFTFDSISTRRADFTFPSSLNSKRFEKVLMYYKLKCSPLTPWDQYNCGEWDYLTYTRVFDHTGDFDSVQVDSVRYLHNYDSQSPFDYEPWGYDYQNTIPVVEHMRSDATINNFSLGQTSTSSATYPFDVSKKGGQYQMILSSSELINAGITAGDIEVL